MSNDELNSRITQVRATLSAIVGADRLNGSFQRAQRHVKDAAMFAKRGATEAAFEKLFLAESAALGAQAMVGR